MVESASTNFAAAQHSTAALPSFTLEVTGLVLKHTELSRQAAPLVTCVGY